MLLKKVSTSVCQKNDTKRLPPCQKLIFDGQDNLLMIMMDASVVQVSLTTHELKEVLTTNVYRQVSKSTMKLYDRVVMLADYNINSHHLVMVFANPAFSGVYNTATGSLYWQVP